jgi:hypothetical protein
MFFEVGLVWLQSLVLANVLLVYDSMYQGPMIREWTERKIHCWTSYLSPEYQGDGKLFPGQGESVRYSKYRGR